MINARIETVTAKPVFKNAIKKRRCIIVANGYYEWKLSKDKVKQPYYFYSPHQPVLAFAGIWEGNLSDNSGDTCAIITIPAVKQVQAIHDRMPAIMSIEDSFKWINPSLDHVDQLTDMLTSSTTNLTYYPVSTKINTPRFNQADCIKPLGEV